MKEEHPGYTPQQPEHGGTFHETESPVHYIERPAPNSTIPNNLWPTLTGNAVDGYALRMTLGHVDARKHTGDAALPLAITNIPGQPDPILDALPVVDGDKIYCEILESTTGVATAAEIKKASAWPTSTAAALAGGSSSGSTGTRNVRLCEIETVDGLVRVKVYHSGNIAHFAPELVENTASPASPGVGGRILKLWNAATGQWLLRMLSKGFGQATITENTDTVEIRGTKKDGEIYIWYGDTEPSTPELTHADGYFTSGATVVGDEAPPVDPERFDIKIPEVVAWDNVDAQIQVSNIGVNGGTKYEVRGNGVDGTLTYTVDGGSPVTVLEWKDGLVITSGTTNDIPIPDIASVSHPWKVTNAGSGNAAIAAGYVLGYYMVYSDANPMMQPSTVAIFPPDEITLAAGSSYSGGTAAITGTQYIYAEIPRNGPTTEYTEARQDYAGVGIASDTTAELYDDIEPSAWTSGAPTDTASIVVSNDEPGTYVPTTGKAAVCIAKAVNNSGTISVTQYVTHNPTVFIPIPWTGTVVTL